MYPIPIFIFLFGLRSLSAAKGRGCARAVVFESFLASSVFETISLDGKQVEDKLLLSGVHEAHGIIFFFFFFNI